MKLRIFLVVILVAAAAVAGRLMNHNSEVARGSEVAASVAGRQEIHERYALAPGSRVLVRGISGSVEVRTAETDTAEVNVVTTARDAADFEGRGVIVEHGADELVVRGEKGAGSFWRWLSGAGQVRHQVTLVLPRRVEFAAKGVNGPVSVGEVEGSVELRGINGRVEVAGAAEHFAASGVNGPVKVAVGRVGDRGVEVEGVNGNIEVRVEPGLNADVDVRGHNGGLTLDVPNVTSHEREHRSRSHARLGSGGASLEFSGINGNIRFVSAAGGATTLVTQATAVPHAVAPLPPPPPAPPAAPVAPSIP